MKTVLITGAGSGIGKALAEVFRKNGWGVIAVAHADMDVADDASMNAYVRKLRGKTVDVLINCAGVYDGPADGDPTATDMDSIAGVFRVNTVGPKALAELLVPNLLAGKERLVVTISSIMGTFGTLDEYSARHWSCGASKMAVNFAMISFGIVHPDIKSVLVHPGWVKTDIGGKDAALEPRKSAEGMYARIINHKTDLPAGKLIDYEGKIVVPFL